MKSRVLILIDGLGAGGAERQMFLTAANLSPQWQVMVWTLHDGIFRKNLEECGIQVVSPARAGIAGAAGSLLGTLRKFRPDIAHAWGSASLLLAWFLFRGRIPIVNGTVRRSFLPGKFSARARLFVSARLGRVTVSNSRAAIGALGLSGARYRVIHNGYSPERSKVDDPVPMDIEKTNVVMVANIKPGKDFLLLIRAAMDLYSRFGKNMPYKFWIVGKPVDLEYLLILEENAESLVSAGCLEFTGGVDTPAGYLASADIGVLLNDSRFHAEGISNSIMEYMAAGLPVVCSDEGGNGELVVHGETGFLVSTSVELIERLEQLRTDKTLAGRMGESGRKRIEKDFSLGAMIRATEDVYRMLLSS